MEEGVFSYHIKEVENGGLKRERRDGPGVDVLEPETGMSGSSPENSTESLTRGQKCALYYRQHRWVMHVLIWMVMTGWWIAGLVLHRDDLGWLIPFLLYLAVTIRLITLHVPTRPILTGLSFVWEKTVTKLVQMIPERFRLAAGAIGTVLVILIGTFTNPQSADNTHANRAIALFGLLVFIFAFYITSNDHRAINWHTVVVGMLAQFILALFVLRTQAGYDIFNFIAFLATSLLGYAANGTSFLLSLDAFQLHWFVITVIPPIIFFIAFVQLLYYWGWLQWAIGKFAYFFFWSMRVSGAEAVVAAASPFVGQGESAMLIRPFIPHLTDAELHQVMTSGFATIAGSVLAAYISMGISPTALISSCVMSIPASLAISKLRYPETEQSLTSGKLVIPETDEEKPQNSLHALGNGSWLGIKIAGMIVAALLCILALLGLINGLLTWWGHYLNIRDPDLTIDLILGYILYPVAFLLGVQRDGDDILKVAQLIGVKIVANEFIAFQNLTKDPSYASLSPRSRLIATYAICGFGNISSVGIQIGVLSQLAPARSGRIARVAFSALCSGVVATLTSASIAGMLVTDGRAFTRFTPGVQG